jgi:hypothetical protein
MNDGIRLRDGGDPTRALDKLRGAHALAHTAITGLELGRDYLALGKLVEARETFLSVARIPVRPDETQRSAAARAECETQARALRDRVPTLVLRVTGVPLDTVSVVIDGAAIPPEALAAPRFLNPGVHTVVAHSTAGGTAQASVDLKEHEAREIELKIVLAERPASAAATDRPPAAAAPSGLSPAPAVTLAESPPASKPRSHVLDWSLVGAGAALAIAGGVVMGIETSQGRDAINRQDHSAYDNGRVAWTVGLVGTVVGGVALASGGILFAATAGNKTSAAGPASFWVGAGSNGLKLGGTW